MRRYAISLFPRFGLAAPAPLARVWAYPGEGEWALAIAGIVVLWMRLD